MKKLNIEIVRNPACPTHHVTIEPADKSWAVYLDSKGMPSLYIGVEAPAEDWSDEEIAAMDKAGESVPTIHAYTPAELFYKYAPEMRPAFEREHLEAEEACKLP